MKICPYKIGDKVQLKNVDYKRPPGYRSELRLPLKPGEVGKVTSIQDRRYIEIDNQPAWYHWTMFDPA